MPVDFLVEPEPFSEDNGLLSGVGKLLRPKLKEHYADRLEQLYADLAANRVSELRALRDGAADRPVIDTLTRAAEALLGLAGGPPEPDALFIELGGDSLSALTFSNLLHDIFDVEVPVGQIIGPATDLRQLAEYVESERESASTAADRSRRCTGVTQRRSARADLTLEKFIDAKTLTEAPALPRAAGTPHTILLTGANGYLGRFLCLEWLERLAETGGQAHLHRAWHRRRTRQPSGWRTSSTAGIRNWSNGSATWRPTISRSSPATSVSRIWAWTKRLGRGWPRAWI